MEVVAEARRAIVLQYINVSSQHAVLNLRNVKTQHLPNV